MATANYSQEDTPLGTPPLDETVWVVICSEHPFFGQRVIIIHRHALPASPYCLVEAPTQPGVRALVSERCLTPADPHTLDGLPLTPQTIRLPLSALDRMVQLIRFLLPTAKDTATHVPDHLRDDSADCDQPAPASHDPAAPAAVPSRTSVHQGGTA